MSKKTEFKPLKIKITLSPQLDKDEYIPKNALIDSWLNHAWQLIDSKNLKAFNNQYHRYNLDILITSESSIQKLNLQFRNQDKPTNVLSFPNLNFDNLETKNFELINGDILGNLVFCPKLINREARSKYKKSQRAHWAHLLIHSFLHLLGYSHDNESDSQKMELMEVKILSELDFENPYFYN